MDQGKVQYIIELLKQGDTKGAIDDLKGLNDQAGKTESGMKSLGETAKTALATIGSALAVRAAIEAFAEYDRAVARLDGTLRATGQYSPEFRGELQAQAKAFADHSVETEKAIMGVQTLLIQFGIARKDLPQFTKAVLDLSAGMGMDARTAALELGKAMDGIDGPLKKIGISFDENAGRGEKLASAITQINGRFGGLAQALAESPSGQLTQTQKAIEGLTEEFGRLATETLIPALKYINELTVATKAFFETSPLAAELAKELITIGGILGTLATGAKGFEIAWSLAGAKSIAEVGSLRTALASLPATVPIVIAAAIVTDAIYQGVLTMQAEHTEKLSAKDLAAQNDSRRKALESQIAGSGKSKNEQDIMLGTLDTAFRRNRGDFGEITARDPVEENAALNKIFSQLNPQVPVRIPGGTTAATAAPAAGGGSLASKLLLDDQKKGLDELDKLTIKLNEESLTGFDKQRQDAEDLFNERSDQIDNIARKQSLNDTHREQVDAARLANFNEFSDKISTINDAQTKQQMDNAAKVQEMKDAFHIETLEGIDKEIALEDLKYQKQIDHINALKDLSPADKTQLLGMAGDAHTSAITQIGQQGKEANRDLVDLGQELQHIGQLAQVNFASGFSNAFLSFVQGTKSAGDAFKQFAADFLDQIAQMILQMLVLKLVQDLVGMGGGGIGGLFGGGGGGIGGGIGVGTGGGGGESLNLGSMFPSASIGGASRALSSISSMVRTPSLSSLGSAGGGSGMSNPNGEIIFKVALHPAFKAEIVSNSVKGAQAQITHDLEHSTPVRAAAKAILS